MSKIPVKDVTPPSKKSDKASDTVNMYQKREKIYVREVEGFFQKLRTWSLWALMLGYFGTAWINIGDRQAVLFDLPARQFHIFNVTFWPQDFMLLSWALIICAFGLFTITNFAGRIWCGYTCPQTVWTDLFILVERWIEGDRNARLRLHRGKWDLKKWRLRIVKWSVWLLIAVATGVLVELLVKKGRLPKNPNQAELPKGFHLWREIGKSFRQTNFNFAMLTSIVKNGFAESGMILRWIFFGTVMAAAIRAFVPQEIFGEWFGPTWVGVLLTLGAATIIEVCSEGSSPIAADLVTRASAPGNGFAFLMAGAATDYTEIMALKETTKSWKATFILPLLTLPQVVVISWILNAWAN